jgi:hypothetical protein
VQRAPLLEDCKVGYEAAGIRALSDMKARNLSGVEGETPIHYFFD